MSPPPRSLTFAVSTSLLTATLVTTGCAQQKRVNEGPEPPHVNPAGPPTDDTTEPAPEEAPPADIVNTVPSEASEPAPE